MANKRRSDLTPQFEWDDSTGQYRYIVGPNKGVFASRVKVRAALDNYLDARTKYVRDLASQLQRREISIAFWQKEMEATIAKIHLASASLAKGGWAQMTRSDYGRVGQILRHGPKAHKGEYEYLAAFAKEIENGLTLDGKFLQRAMQYAQAGRSTFYILRDIEMERLGADEARNRRHARDSCAGGGSCIQESRRGWVKRGQLIQIGYRKCRRWCRCDKIYRNSVTGQVWD